MSEGATRLDLHGRSMMRQDLHDRDFRNANLAGVNFELANLTNVTFVGADVGRARFVKANLHHADMTGLDLSTAALEGAVFVDANLSSTNLEGQTLYLSGAEALLPDRAVTRDLPYGVTASMLVERDNGKLAFRGANLRDTRIFGSLVRVDFRRADLRGADLSGATEVEQAIFNGAIYDSRTRWPIDPGEVRAVHGPEAPPSTSFFRGRWVIEEQRPSGPPASDIALLDIAADGSFVWDIADMPSAHGRWRTGTASADGTSLILEGGEGGKQWIASVSSNAQEDRIELRSAAEVRLAHRASNR